MVHVERPPPMIGDIVDQLRPGDVLTHCCRAFPNSVSMRDGTVNGACQAPRPRGVVFDIGHGRGSFDYASFRRMRDSGFVPDVVSSDVHAVCRAGPAVDQLTTMNKLIGLGVGLADVVRMATHAPADVLGRDDLGTLRIGATADVSVLELANTPAALLDSAGAALDIRPRLIATGAVRGGV